MESQIDPWDYGLPDDASDEELTAKMLDIALSALRDNGYGPSFKFFRDSLRVLERARTKYPEFPVTGSTAVDIKRLSGI